METSPSEKIPFELDAALDGSERGTRKKVYQSYSATTTRTASVAGISNKLGLSPVKKAAAEKLGNRIFELGKNLERTEKRAYEIRLESLLVEWGVAPTSARKQPYYRGIARLVAAAAAVAE